MLDNLAKKLEDNNINPKDWWKTFKYFIKPDKPSPIPPLDKDGTIYLSAEEKANVLNNFFHCTNTLRRNYCFSAHSYSHSTRYNALVL